MRHSSPNKTLWLALFGLCLFLPICTHGQRAERPEPTRAFNCGFLYGLKPPRVFIIDAEGEYVPLRVDSTRLQSWQEIPAADSVTFFKRTKDAEGKTVMQPQATYALPPGTDPVRLLFYYDQSGQVQHRILIDDPEAHRALQVRAINLTDTEVGVNFGADSLVLQAGEDSVFTDINFNFRFGTRSERNTPYISPKRLLRFPRPQMRLSVIFAYRPRPADDGDGYEFDLEAMRFYDFGAR